MDTLRDEACPVCGETDSYDGNQCRVCGFVQPPKQFQDPDLDAAKQMDLRKNNGDMAPGDLGDVEDDVNDLDGDGFDDKTGLPVNAEEAGALDQQPLLTCDNCGEQFPAGEPMTTDTRDPQAADMGTGPDEGDVCPACGKGMLIAGEGAAEEEGGMPPGEEDPDADPDADDEEQDGEPGQYDPTADADQDDEDPDDDGDVDDGSEEDTDDDSDPAKKKKNPFSK